MPDNECVELQREFEGLIETARRVSADIAAEVEAVLREGRERPLPPEEAVALLTRVVAVLKRNARRRGDPAVLRSLEGDVNQLVEQLLVEAGRARPAARNGRPGQAPASQAAGRLALVAHNGIAPAAVQPRPCFHGVEVPMNGGFVKTTDINLWDKNERLDIHLGQFREEKGRAPTAAEVLDIMLSRMDLPGLTKADQFEIVDIARSIAINGVRKPPILDTDGTPLDGNRRIAACYYILSSDEFTAEQKRRAEYIYVWQLTDQATEPERNAVVVSLNFEPDYKLAWPKYVKVRKVYEEWQAVLGLELRPAGQQRQAVLKRELSEKFALGPDTGTVNRYIKMAEGAIDFEDYHINQRGRNEYEVKHRANEYIEYFDELAKGARNEGVAYVLEQDPGFKHLVYDLLYEGKFQNWRQIRELKRVYDNQEASELLNKARQEPDAELAEEHLRNAVAVARTRSAEQRELGANTRIESFVEFLEQLPPRAFRDNITPENLGRLLRALALVQPIVERVLEEKGAEQ